MTIEISSEQARQFLADYHLSPTTIAGVFERLGCVQYDPLNPVGRNADLVLQARVSGYQVNDWQALAYTDRLIYDAWDKQACLVPSSDWPHRAIIRARYHPYHDREILLAEPKAAAAILAAIDRQGPLSSLEIEDRSRMADQNSWYGTTLSKRIMRALWANGLLITHHREGGRHYYDRPERIIPPEYFMQPDQLDEATYLRWIMQRRLQSMGLLRLTAEAAIWSACGDAKQRTRAMAELVENGVATPVLIGEKRWPYYVLTSILPKLEQPAPPEKVTFLAPLDSLLWDRKTIKQLFNFDYTWEVYKPVHLRKWGYYVLPVFYRDRFIARLDSRLMDHTWQIARWWWEPGIEHTSELRAAVEEARQRFVHYLKAKQLVITEETA